jgi:hypothetical protein
MLAKPSDRDLLLVVDVQNDFLPGGALAVPEGDAIVPLINALAQRFAHVTLTQDWHVPGHLSFASSHAGRAPFETITLPYGPQILWPDQCVQGSLGAEFSPALSIPRAGLIVPQGFSPRNRQLLGILRGGRRDADRPRRLSTRARLRPRLYRGSCHRLLCRVLRGRCTERRLRGDRHRGRVPRDRYWWIADGGMGKDERCGCRTDSIDRVGGLTRFKDRCEWLCRMRKRKRHPVARAAQCGGGGGTADPSLSRRAGLCLHPARRMRGVLSVHRCGRILVPARCAFTPSAGL